MVPMTFKASKQRLFGSSRKNSWRSKLKQIDFRPLFVRQ